jgi:uncharacterized coiled-coil protein SlyX|tara:strand:- start:536 stop:715 length:180 start_codon:yes stop_codon:yes gene_type:complete
MGEMKNLVDTLQNVENAFEELSKFVVETRTRLDAIERQITILKAQTKYMQEGVPGDLYE